MTTNTPTMARRTILSGSLALGGLALLSACASPSGSGSGSSSGGGSKTGFSMSNWSDAPAVSELYIKIVADYEKSTGVKVDRLANIAFNDYNTKFRTLLAGGQPPDVMRLNDDFLREMADKKLVRDLAPYFKGKDGINVADYYADVLDFGKFGSAYRALPIGLSPRVIYYNKTAFQAAGVPLPPSTWTMKGWSWDDFLSAAQALTKGTEQYGLEMTLDSGIEESWPRNNGGPGIYSKDGRTFTLAEDQGVEAMQWIADLAVKHKVGPQWASIQGTNAHFDLFTTGKVTMNMGPMSDYTYYQGAIKDFEWGIAPLPGKVDQVQTGGFTLFVIPSKAKNPDAAWDFLHYLSGEAGGQVFASNAAFIPVNRKAAATVGAAGSIAKGDLKLFVEAADHQGTTNSVTAASQSVALYRPLLQQAYAGGTTVKKAFDGVKDQINSLLKA